MIHFEWVFYAMMALLFLDILCEILMKVFKGVTRTMLFTIAVSALVVIAGKLYQYFKTKKTRNP